MPAWTLFGERRDDGFTTGTLGGRRGRAGGLKMSIVSLESRVVRQLARLLRIPEGAYRGEVGEEEGAFKMKTTLCWSSKYLVK